ncbi:MAG: hypothetical protein FD167_2733 [bacterium]|nr:MAG: hypothetical protein FD167_2733 [bacterium]
MRHSQHLLLLPEGPGKVVDNADVDKALERLNETWAQAAIKFDIVGRGVRDNVSNTIRIKGDLLGETTFMIKVDGTQVGPINIGMNGRITSLQAAEDIVKGINTKFNDQRAYVFNAYPNINPNFLQQVAFVVINRGTSTELKDISVSGSNNIIISKSGLPAGEVDVENVAPSLVANFADQDPNIIDFFIVKIDNRLVTNTEVGNMVNTAFIAVRAVDNSTNNPFTVSHEAGHILFNFGHVDDKETTNLMFKITPPLDQISAAKRITLTQHSKTRNKSITDSLLKTP